MPTADPGLETEPRDVRGKPKARPWVTGNKEPLPLKHFFQFEVQSVGTIG